MPRSLRLADGSYMRRPDIQNITQYVTAMQCVEVIGFSNIGKSALLRLLSQSDVWEQELGEAGKGFLPIYIDCNRMLDMSEQGFYELVLRCFQESSHELTALPELAAAYEKLVEPSSEFQIPLNFNRGLTSVLESTQRKLVLLFDEFDEPFTQIDSRVFLNLRALKDRHGSELVYVTATVQPITMLRPEEDHCSEFCELFSHRTWYLSPLIHTDVDRMIRRYMDAYEASFETTDFDFIYQWAGGHPCMLEGVCRMLEDAIENSDLDLNDPALRWQLHRTVARQIRINETLNYECNKIWEACSEEERTALGSLFHSNEEANSAVIESLTRRHILRTVEGKPQLFCRLLAEYVQRQVVQERPESVTLWVDVESGEVSLGGKPLEALTNLEYRLMVLLFQNADKIVNKYQIVTSVWGESYIDEVDDARIEKLISRLRQKVEPDPSNPRFLITVRGRGYRLLLSEDP